jgi:hypothetical protein
MALFSKNFNGGIMNEDRVEELKSVTVSRSEARRIAIQTDDLDEVEFKELLERIAKKNQK